LYGFKICPFHIWFQGVAGEINVDITPEYASKLGAATELF